MTTARAIKCELKPQTRILLVDRNSDMADMLCTFVEICGHQPIRASTGAEAAKLAVDLSPAIVITAMRLPDCSGNELASRLRADPRTSSAVFILITGENTSALSGDAVHPFDHVIQKPFRIESLMKLLSCEARPCPAHVY
jgi:CheY-like chemotaxis protein